MHRVLKPPEAKTDGCIAFLTTLYPDLCFLSKNIDLDKNYKTCDTLIHSPALCYEAYKSLYMLQTGDNIKFVKLHCETYRMFGTSGVQPITYRFGIWRLQSAIHLTNMIDYRPFAACIIFCTPRNIKSMSASHVL